MEVALRLLSGMLFLILGVSKAKTMTEMLDL